MKNLTTVTFQFEPCRLVVLAKTVGDSDSYICQNCKEIVDNYHGLIDHAFNCVK